MILIVDDDEETRKLLASILQEHNYETVLAPGAEEALDIFACRTSEIQLVIMDIMMPGMSGIEASAEMTKIEPNIPVLLMSGHLYDLDQPFLHKPFRTSQVVGYVRLLAV